MSIKFFFIILFIYATIAVCSEQVPANRLGDWTKAGLYKYPPPVGTIINITHPDYGATPDNDSDDDYDAIEKALEEARNQPNLTVIYFPAGIYHIYQPIVLSKNENDGNIVFIGAGESTVLRFPSLKNNYPFRISGNRHRNIRIDLLSDLHKDDYIIYVDPHELSQYDINLGDWIQISEFNSTRMTDADPEQLGQIFQIGYIVEYAGIICLTTKASLDFKEDKGLCIIKMEPIKNVGIENLKIVRYRDDGERNHYSESSNILFLNSLNCWIKGVHFNHTFEHHIKTRYSAHLEISGCYFNDAFYVGDGGYGYGVALGASTTMCLIENNIFRLLRHSQIVQDGANTNVFGYNYSREQEWKIDGYLWIDEIKMPDNTGQDITIHGDYPFTNLFEGNYAINIWADDVHGRNGPYNTILRNYTSNPRSDLIDAMTFERIDYVNFIGNDHIDNLKRNNTDHFLNLYTLEYPDGYPWEYYDSKKHNDRLDSYHFLNEISYYYCNENYISDISYKPEFLDGYEWPPIGPPTNIEYDEIIEYQNQDPPIPAKDRWKNQLIKTYNLNPTIHDLPSFTLPTGISTSSTISGTFEVEGAVIITNEAVLTINAGTKILMHPGSSILTERGGKIIANGNSTENVEIKRYDENEPWDKIELRSGGNRFNYCIIDGGTNNIFIKSKDNIFSDCNITDATQGGVRTNYTYGTSNYSDYSLLNCTINNNRYGVYSYKSYGDIQTSRIHNNSLYGLRIAYSKVGDNSAISDHNQYFIDNIIHDNGSYGIYILTGGILHSGYGEIQGRNQIINNAKHEIYISGRSAMIFGNESTYGYHLWSSIYDNVYANSRLNKYISNYAKTPERQPVTVYALSTYWGTSSGPSPDNFRGYFVDYSNYLTSDTSLFESAPISENVNYQMIVSDNYDLNPSTELNQSLQDKIESDQMNSLITNTKTLLTEIRNEMKDQNDLRETNRRLYEYFRVQSSLDKTDVHEKTEIRNILKNYTNNLDELSEYNNGEMKLLAENAAMQEIFILLNDGNYSGSIKLINKYEKYINNFDNYKELLDLKMDCFYTLGQYQEAYETLRELKKYIYEDRFLFDIPTYEVFERDLCEKLNIEYGLLDKLVAEEYLTDQGNKIPASFALHQNYPNPFNPSTTIPLSIPESSTITIKIYNNLGQLISTLVDQKQVTVGKYNFLFMGKHLASGIYIVMAEVSSETGKNMIFKNKMILLK